MDEQDRSTSNGKARKRDRRSEQGELRPAEDAREKRRTPSDEVEEAIPSGGKLGRAHD